MNKQKQKQKQRHITHANKARKNYKVIEEAIEAIFEKVRIQSNIRWNQILHSLRRHAR